MPNACYRSTRSVVCVNAAVYYLDHARQLIGLPPYLPPANFPGLPADDQILILRHLVGGSCCLGCESPRLTAILSIKLSIK
jgi:hypothetical protein